MITTDWVKIYDYLEYRYQGPKWIAWLIVRTDGKSINPIIGHAFQAVCKLFGAKLQYRKPL